MAERNVTVRLRAVIDGYRTAMQAATKETSKFAAAAKGEFGKLGSDMKKLGDDMTRKVTLPLAATGIGATKLASDFETAFAQMVGLANVPAAEIDGLRQAVLGLSHETARSPQELAEALYYIRSSGVSAAASLDVLNVAAKASAGGLGQTQDIARAVGFAINAYGEQNLSAARAADILVATIREGTIEADQLAPVMGQLIPTASALGIGFDQVAATMAVMSRNGSDAAESATGISAVMSTLLGTSQAGTQLLTEHGLSLKKLRDIAAGPDGLVGVFRLLDQTFQGNDEELATIIPNIRALRTFMNVLAQDGTQVDEVLRAITAASGTTSEAFEAMRKTRAFQLRQDFNDAKIALVQLGAALAPFAAVLGAIGVGVFATFGQLPGLAKSAIAAFLLLLAAVGPVSKAAGVLVSNFQTLFRLLQTGALNAVGHLQAIGLAAGVATVAIGAIAYVWARNKQAAADAAAAAKGYADAIRDAGSVVDGIDKRLRDIFAGGKNSTLLDALDRAGVTVKELAAAVDAGGPKLDEMRRRLLMAKAPDIVTADQLELLDRFGFGIGDVVDAVLGGEAGMRRFEGAVASAMGVSVTEATAEVGGLEDGLVGLRDSLDGESRSAKKGADDAARLGRVLNDTTTSTTASALSFDFLGNAAGNASAMIAFLESSLQGITASTFAVFDAQNAYADALAAVDEATQSSGGSTRNLAKDQRSLEQASKDVTKAQQALADAEEALRVARQGPTERDKKDASLEVRDAQLGLAEAQRAVADAQKRVREERAKGKDGDVKGATLDLQRAQLQLERAQLRVADAQAAQNEVLHSGEDTSKKVKDAVDAVTEAQDRLTEAQQRQADAEAQIAEPDGGPVARSATAKAAAFKTLRERGQDVVENMLAQKATAPQLNAEIEAQRRKIDELRQKYGDLNGELQKYSEWLDKIEYVTVGINPVTGEAIRVPRSQAPVGARANGGPVTAGRSYLVGELGPELLTLGSTSGHVTSNATLTAASAFGDRSLVKPIKVDVPLQLRLDGGVVADALVRFSHNTSGVDIKILNS